MSLLSSPFAADWLQAALGLVVITNLALLGAERQRLCIRLIALQGMIVGLLPLLTYKGQVEAYLLIVSLIFFTIKGIILPLLLGRTHRHLPAQASFKPYMGYSVCVLLGVLGFAMSMWLGDQLGLSANPMFSLVFPTAFTTILAGLLLIVTGKEVLSQLFGYLVMENGIFLLGTPMVEQAALWVELSILLDILVAAFVMGIAIHHINRAFDSTDVEHIASLRD